MNIVKKIKDAIIEFNAKRTLPDCVIYEYEGSYWAECKPNKSGAKFINEIDKSPYQYKYVEYKQKPSGKWVKARLELLSDSNIEILKRTSK